VVVVGAAQGAGAPPALFPDFDFFDRRKPTIFFPFFFVGLFGPRRGLLLCFRALCHIPIFGLSLLLSS
jgi:hypothetical protein